MPHLASKSVIEEHIPVKNTSTFKFLFYFAFELCVCLSLGGGRGGGSFFSVKLHSATYLFANLCMNINAFSALKPGKKDLNSQHLVFAVVSVLLAHF